MSPGFVENCPHCVRLQKAALKKLDVLLWENEHSIVVAGDHQFFPGYCMVVSKFHVREMHDLPAELRHAIFADVMKVGSAVSAAYRPWKMNYASLGNIDEHLHWHVIPRYESDPDHRDHPWKNAGKFSSFATTPAMLADLKRKIHP